MRLLNVQTFKLEEFFGKAVPQYAVLSHTWGNYKEEVSFRDVEDGSIGENGTGPIKIVGCCKQAMKDGLNYAWIDTCCIDKANSVELGEAINSMFQWYANASICYAYLSDVPAGEKPRDHGSAFSSSRWFKRGWTLQELLAPKELRFYDSIWSCLGTKRALSAMVQKITGIPRPFLIGLASLHEASVAQRMSWASKRVTGRKEDVAYCLLGIFGVILPMIYGEGEQAFNRLQEVIMKNTGDDSILAWGFDPSGSISTNSKNMIEGGILAAAPADFENCGHIVSREQPQSPLEVSGGRLRVQLPLYTTSTGETYGILNCGLDSEIERVVGIPLINNVTTHLSNEYMRPQGQFSTLFPRTKSNSSTKLIYIQMGDRIRAHTGANRRHWFYIDDPSEANLELVEVEPPARWKRGRSMITTEIKSDRRSTQRTLTRFRIEDQASYDFIVVLEFEAQGSQVEARCHVMISSRDTNLGALSQKLIRMGKEAFGKQSASNGVLSIYVTVTQEFIVGQPMFVVKLAATPRLPKLTIDASKELQLLDLQLELEGTLQEENDMGLEAEQLRQQKEEETRSLLRKLENKLKKDNTEFAKPGRPIPIRATQQTFSIENGTRPRRLPTPQSAQSAGNENSRLQKKLDEAKAEITEAQTRYSQLETEYKQYQEERVKATATKIEESKRIDQLLYDFQILCQERDILKEVVSELEKNLEEAGSKWKSYYNRFLEVKAKSQQQENEMASVQETNQALANRTIELELQLKGLQARDDQHLRQPSPQMMSEEIAYLTEENRRIKEQLNLLVERSALEASKNIDYYFFDDPYFRREFSSVRGGIEDWAVRVFAAESRRVEMKPSKDVEENLRRISASWGVYMKSHDHRVAFVQAYIWGHLLRSFFGQSDCEGEIGGPSTSTGNTTERERLFHAFRYAAARFHAPKGGEMQAMKLWISQNMSRMLDDIFDPLEAWSTLPKPQSCRLLQKVLEDVFRLDLQMRQQKAYFQVCGPKEVATFLKLTSPHDVVYNAQLMESRWGLPSEREKQRVELFIKPMLVKRGTTDGQDYGGPTIVLEKAWVDLKRPKSKRSLLGV